MHGLVSYLLPEELVFKSRDDVTPELDKMGGARHLAQQMLVQMECLP